MTLDIIFFNTILTLALEHYLFIWDNPSDFTCSDILSYLIVTYS